MISTIFIFSLFLFSFNCISIPIERKQFDLNKGQTLYVGGTGPNNYTRVQDAIDDANNGDTIFIFEGIYHESNITIDKSIEIIGENKENTTIDGDESYKHNVIKIIMDYVKISNLIIKDSCPQKAGITIRSKYNEINYCTFVNNGYFGGICLPQTSENNIIKNSSFIDNLWSIHIQGWDSPSKNHIISNCYFKDNSILIYYADNIIIENCILEDWSGIQTDYICNEIKIENCNISDYTTGISIYSTGDDIKILNCSIDNCTNYGIYIYYEQTDLEIIGCNISNTGSSGIIFWTYIEKSKIKDCYFIGNKASGICFFGGVKYVEISDCHFEKNKEGIDFHMRTLFNKIYRNNFIENNYSIETSFHSIWLKFMFNFYKNNYFDIYDGKDWNGDGFGEKPFKIYGFLNLDLRPRINPY